MISQLYKPQRCPYLTPSCPDLQDFCNAVLFCRVIRYLATWKRAAQNAPKPGSGFRENRYSSWPINWLTLLTNPYHILLHTPEDAPHTFRHITERRGQYYKAVLQGPAGLICQGKGLVYQLIEILNVE